MADKNLRVSIVLQAADKALGPLKKISQGSSETAQTLKAARDQLKQLEQTQRQMTGFQRVSAELRKNNRELTAAQSQVQKYTATLEDQRTRHQAISANLRTAKQAYAQITKAYQDGKLHGEEYTRQIELARISLLANEQAHGRSKAAIDKYKAQVRNATERVSKLGESVKKGQERLDGYKQRLEAAGLSTERLAAQKRAMKGNIDATTAAIEKQVRALKRQEEQQRKLAEIQKQAQKAAAVGAGMAGAGAVGMYAGQRALRGTAGLLGAGVDFDAQMSKVQALTRLEKTSADYAMLRAQALELGASTMFSATEAAQGQAFLAMAGFDPKAIKGAMPGLLDMAKAGDLDLGRTADISSNILSAFGIDPNKMGSVADTLTKVFTTSNVNLEMLGNTMSYVGPVARAAGVDLETTAAMAGLLGNVGIQGEKGGTAMRAMLLRLSAPTGGAAKMLDKLKVKTRDAQGNVRNVMEVLADLAKQTEKMGSAQKLEALKTIFGEEPAAAMTELLSQAGSGGILEYLNKVRDSAGAAGKTAGIMSDNVTGDLDELSSTWEDVRIALFDANAQEIRTVLQTFTEALRGVGDWFKANPIAATWLVRLIIGVSVFTGVVGALLIPLGLLVAKGMLMRFVFAKAFAAFAASGGVIGIIQGGIARVAGGFGLLVRWGTALLRLNPFAAWVVGIFGFVHSLFENWGKIKAAFNAGDWSAIGGFIIQGLEAGLNMATLGLYGFIKSMLSGLVTVVKKILGIHSPSTVFAEIGGFIMDGLILGITRLLSALKGVLVGLWGSMVSAVGSAVSAFVDSIKSTLSGGVSAWLAALLNFSPLGLLWNTFTTALAALGVQVPEQFRNFGSFIMDGLIGGITGKLAALKDTVVGVASSAAKWFANKLDMHSPSRVFTQFGGWISEGAANGIEAGQAAVRAAALAMAGAAMVPVANAESAPPSAAPIAAIKPAAPRAAATAPVAAGTSNYNITINAAPGMDAQAIARAVAAELDRRERQSTARRNSSLHDIS